MTIRIFRITLSHFVILSLSVAASNFQLHDRSPSSGRSQIDDDVSVRLCGFGLQIVT